MLFSFLIVESRKGREKDQDPMHFMIIIMYWESYNVSLCIEKYCSFHMKHKNIKKVLWMDFYDFLKIFTKI
jgi:hypothetical protein